MKGFEFTNYKLRPTHQGDIEHCRKWIESDADHRGRVQPEFFCTPEVNEECFVLEDLNGEPVFYFKMARALRIHIQFGPAATREEKLRNARGMSDGFDWLFALASQSGFREILFDSKNPPLTEFCKTRFGFQESPMELIRPIGPVRPQESLENSGNHVQHDIETRGE